MAIARKNAIAATCPDASDSARKELANLDLIGGATTGHQIDAAEVHQPRQNAGRLGRSDTAKKIDNKFVALTAPVSETGLRKALIIPRQSANKTPLGFVWTKF